MEDRFSQTALEKLNQRLQLRLAADHTQSHSLSLFQGLSDLTLNNDLEKIILDPCNPATALEVVLEAREGRKPYFWLNKVLEATNPDYQKSPTALVVHLPFTVQVAAQNDAFKAIRFDRGSFDEPPRVQINLGTYGLFNSCNISLPANDVLSVRAVAAQDADYSPVVVQEGQSLRLESAPGFVDHLLKARKFYPAILESMVRVRESDPNCSFYPLARSMLVTDDFRKEGYPLQSRREPSRLYSLMYVSGLVAVPRVSSEVGDTSKHSVYVLRNTQLLVHSGPSMHLVSVDDSEMTRTNLAAAIAIEQFRKRGGGHGIERLSREDAADYLRNPRAL